MRAREARSGSDLLEEGAVAQIFVSYAREDQPTAARVAEALEGHGWDVWWDRQLGAGQDWSVEIQDRLREVGCVVVLWSTASIESRWVQAEADVGQRRKILVPLAIAGCQPPFGYAHLHTVDLSSWSGGQDHSVFREIQAAVERLVPLGKEAEARAAPVSARSGPARERRSWTPAVIAVVAAAALAGVGLWYGTRSSPPAEPPAPARAAPVAPTPPPLEATSLTFEFAPRQSDLDSAALGRLRALAPTLEATPGARVVVKGHGDASEGDGDSVQRLSEERARRVRDLLISEGVDPSQVAAIGFGEVFSAGPSVEVAITPP